MLLDDPQDQRPLGSDALACRLREPHGYHSTSIPYSISAWSIRWRAMAGTFSLAARTRSSS